MSTDKHKCKEQSCVAVFVKCLASWRLEHNGYEIFCVTHYIINIPSKTRSEGQILLFQWHYCGATLALANLSMQLLNGFKFRLSYLYMFKLQIDTEISSSQSNVSICFSQCFLTDFSKILLKNSFKWLLEYAVYVYSLKMELCWISTALHLVQMPGKLVLRNIPSTLPVRHQCKMHYWNQIHTLH